MRLAMVLMDPVPLLLFSAPCNGPHGSGALHYSKTKTSLINLLPDTVLGGDCNDVVSKLHFDHCIMS